MKIGQIRLLFVLVLVTGVLPACHSNAQTGLPKPTSEAKSKLYREAQQAAEEFLTHSYYQCGDSYFMREQAIEYPPQYHRQVDQRPVYWQIKGFAWKVKGEDVIVPPLTEAERLNGVTRPVGEWKGEILVSGTVYRMYVYENWPRVDLTAAGKPIYQPGKWTPWKDIDSVLAGEPLLQSFPFTKQEAPCSPGVRPACILLPNKPFRFGKWVVGSSNRVSPEEITPVDCNAIPPESLRVSEVADPVPPKIQNPSSPVPATVVADPKLVPPGAIPKKP